jgi:hypothetical protein
LVVMLLVGDVMIVAVLWGAIDAWLAIDVGPCL